MQPQPSDGRRIYRVQRRRRAPWFNVLLIALIVVLSLISAAAFAHGFGIVSSPFEASGVAGAETHAARTVAATPAAAIQAPHGIAPTLVPGLPIKKGDGVKVETFLGNETRRFYGLGPVPKQLDVIWAANIGTGKTSGPKGKTETWSGTGWTGQPAIVRDHGKLYLLVGGYDHNLHKIDARTGEVVWEYPFDDVIKSSPSVFENPKATSAADRYVVVAGSRQGYPMNFTDPSVAPYRAVSFATGHELWRLPAPLTASYSRDCDGSGFYLDGRLYIGLEDGWFYDLDPSKTTPWNGYQEPIVKHSRLLLGDSQTQAAHQGNLVLESSPSLLGDTIYVSSGAGFVYGLRRSDLKVVWSYRTGSDMDGSAVPTNDGRLLVPIEKQYIPGHGGVMMLDPGKPADKAPVWFFPTGERAMGDWAGGVIGSVSVNDDYNPGGLHPALAAFSAIDGNLYVVSQDTLAPERVPGPNLEPDLRTPVTVFSAPIGGAISTPIMVGDSIIAAGYDAKVHLYHIAYALSHKGAEGALQSPNGNWWRVSIHETTTFSGGGSFESTPVVWDGRVYIGCRNGYLYCLGVK